MGPPAATCLILLGASLLLFDFRTRSGRAPYQIVALLATAVPAISLLGYLYHVRQLYGVAALTGIALQTASSFLLLGMSVLLARPDAGFMRVLAGRDSGALLTRRLLPWAFFLPITITTVRVLGEQAGLYDPEFGRALLAFAFMIAFASLIWWTGRVVRRQEDTAESSRTEIQDRLVQSLETMNDGFIACDSGWRITYMNASAEIITSLVRDRVLGRDFWEAFPDAVGTEVERHYRRAMQERVPVQFETFYEPYGRFFENEVLPTADGGLAIYRRDITDRQRALDVLQDADRRKNRFLATLAHELRNPLAPVRNAVQLLRLKKNPEPDAAWAHAVIDRQVDHLTRLIEDLMDVSRISYGKLELRKERVSLAEVIAAAIESSRPSIESLRHRLVVQLPDQPLSLNADSIRLAQVFMNLLTNAAKYTPPGGTITLAAAREGSDVVVRVCDTGAGLPAEQLPHLFEMFFQSGDVLKRTQGGLGIGLALVRHLVELHGGTVTATSEGKNLGSEFRVRLPLALDPAPEPARPPASGARPSLQGRRVLVVDDNRDATTSMVRLLEITGAETRNAYDGQQALALIAREEFEIALLDIGLPKVSGHDLAREIRKQEWGKKAVLVALTGWGQNDDRERSKEAGFDHHLVKPVSPEALLSLLAGAGVPSSEELGG
jgi:PAS domain S-box-containing protein